MARVVVIGGGYGGITVTKGLNPIAEVVFVEQKDQSVYHVAALRIAVDKVWEQAIFVPYTSPLTRGHFVHGTVSHVEGTTVYIYGHDPIEADYLVFTTSSTCPFPAKYPSSNSAAVKACLAQLHENFEGVRSVMLAGGGTVGIKFAGELAHTFPETEIIIIEKEDMILSSSEYSGELCGEISAQFAELGIRVITRSELAFLPPHNIGEPGHFQVSALGGEQIRGDVWFRCHGAAANTGYLHGTDYEEFLRPNDTLRVKKGLQVMGHEHSYTVDDLTDVRESKRADATRQQARVVIANLSALIAGGPPEAVYGLTKE